MQISKASFEGGAEVDCGHYQDGVDIRYRVTIRQIEDDIFQVYRYDVLPIDLAGCTHTLRQGTLEECAKFVTEEFGWKLEVVKTFKCEACLGRGMQCKTDVSNHPKSHPTKCRRGLYPDSWVKWEVVA